MFYEQMVLAKKGPLGNVWLAAHWEKKLTKLQIIDTDVVDTVGLYTGWFEGKADQKNFFVFWARQGYQVVSWRWWEYGFE